MKQTIKLTESELKKMIKEVIENNSISQDPTYRNNFYAILGKFYEKMDAMEKTIKLLYSFGKNFLGHEKSVKFYNTVIGHLYQMENGTQDFENEVSMSFHEDEDDEDDIKARRYRREQYGY